MRKIVYHGSSNKNLKNKIKPNSLLFFTTSKEDAHQWADRALLGGKRKNAGTYIYTAEIQYKKPYKCGDEKVNPEYAEYKDNPEYEEIASEIFFEDLNENLDTLLEEGYDCFILPISDDVTYYIISESKKNNIKWIDMENLTESIDLIVRTNKLLEEFL